MTNSNEHQRLKERLEFLKRLEKEKIEYLEHLKEITKDEELKNGIEKVIKYKKSLNELNDWDKGMERWFKR